VSYNTLEEIDDMVTGKRANIRLSDNYEDVSNIPVNMENQREAIPKQRERKIQR